MQGYLFRRLIYKFHRLSGYILVPPLFENKFLRTDILKGVDEDCTDGNAFMQFRPTCQRWCLAKYEILNSCG